MSGDIYGFMRSIYLNSDRDDFDTFNNPQYFIKYYTKKGEKEVLFLDNQDDFKNIQYPLDLCEINIGRADPKFATNTEIIKNANDYCGGAKILKQYYVGPFLTIETCYAIQKDMKKYIQNSKDGFIKNSYADLKNEMNNAIDNENIGIIMTKSGFKRAHECEDFIIKLDEKGFIREVKDVQDLEDMSIKEGEDSFKNYLKEYSKDTYNRNKNSNSFGL